MPADDLWGDLKINEDLRVPYSLVREQAAFLEKKTDGLLIGEAKRTEDGETFIISLWIVAPALSNYRYKVFELTHGIKLYPLSIRDSLGRKANCDDEEEFIEIVKTIFADEQIQKVITGLIAQIRAE